VVRSGDADVCDGSFRGKAGEVSVGASSLHLRYVREGPLWPVAIHQKHVCACVEHPIGLSLPADAPCETAATYWCRRTISEKRRFET